MKKLLLAALSLFLLAAAAWWLLRPKNGKDSSPELVPVTVERGDIVLGIQATGSVEPQNRVPIRPPFAGRLEQVLSREGDWVKKGQILAWLSSNDRAALLDAARSRGPEELARWEQLYRATPLLSPINGTIIARYTEPGQSVGASDAVVVVSDRLIVKAQVDETDIAKVKVGQPARVTLDAYQDKKLPSRVDHVAYEARTVNNVTIYDVEVLPKTIPPFMRSGMTASVDFEADSRRDVLWLPSDAVEIRRGHGIVKVALGPLTPSAALKSVTKSVETGLSDGLKIEIVSGLEEGDTVLSTAVSLPKGEAAQSSPLLPKMPSGGGGRRQGRGRQ